MSGEFKKRIELLGLEAYTQKRVMDLIKEAGEAFPCLECPSKDECKTFRFSFSSKNAETNLKK